MVWLISVAKAAWDEYQKRDIEFNPENPIHRGEIHKWAKTTNPSNTNKFII